MTDIDMDILEDVKPRNLQILPLRKLESNRDELDNLEVKAEPEAGPTRIKKRRRSKDESVSKRRAKIDGRIGEISGIAVGDHFLSRKAMSQRGLHNKLVAGIAGNKEHGALSIVVSGKYEDDVDQGNVIYYTGAGGQKNAYRQAGPQTVDQTFDNHSNACLQVSQVNRTAVRVIRGHDSNSKYAPGDKGFRYDGLYWVDDSWLEDGKHGFKVCKFKLKRFPGQPPLKVREYATPS
ncbi:hypothetical protein D9758_006160 [Tetrapyrgos nigripes]|uniref:YDG domain-containing protein n=1 Tax=Tetrapyrgos nigripes TaxID=182062 RepID=A0A8H5GAY4_9AGAR|nr:hypothetical protein D9758_006160 [Tetrapyrgos nigripes]